jgi:hypothetical protein
MSVTFLLLEIADPEVNAFLWFVRYTLTGRRPEGPIHLTLRGPYEGEGPAEAIETARDALKRDVLRIAGVGRFSNPGEEVVFLRVDSPHLRDVWWKPSFPIKRFGFEPHISIYRGHDKEFADRIAGFFTDHHIELLCAEHRVVWHQSRQPNLFAAREPAIHALALLPGSTRVDFSVLEQLREFVESYRSERRDALILRESHPK